MHWLGFRRLRSVVIIGVTIIVIVLIHILRIPLESVILVLILIGFFFDLIVESQLSIDLIRVASLYHLDSKVQRVDVEPKFFISSVVI